MATNAGPIYGKQYIRYAETWECPANNQAGTQGVVEVGELRCVSYATWAGPNYACTGNDFNPSVAQATIVGVNQAYMPSVIASPQTRRQLTVAQSGLLLVENDNQVGGSPLVTPADLNTQLRINKYGQASKAAGAVYVTLDGTQPFVREIVSIGGRDLVLVSFA